jgi:hypothetical protein
MQTQKQSPALAGEPGSEKQTRTNHTTIRRALMQLTIWTPPLGRWAA